MKTRKTSSKEIVLAPSRVMALVIAAAVAIAAGAATAHARTHRASSLTKGPQASITLGGANMVPVQSNNTSWDVSKVLTAPTAPIQNVDSLTWTVTVTKLAVSDTNIVANGYVTVQNTGTANATIGNIVVNLQHRCNPKSTSWGSLSVDVADATSGDSATSANIVAAASQETTSSCRGADYAFTKYSACGANFVKGTFSENAFSGTLQFNDDGGNSFFSVIPDPTIVPGQIVNLYYQASFDNTQLGLSPGAQIRTETIVTFGNAGGRGGSGASAPSIDIDGNSTVDCAKACGVSGNECWVRSVPTRFSTTVPSTVINCNQDVTLTDTEKNLTVTGTVSESNFSTDPDSVNHGTGCDLVLNTGECIDGSTLSPGGASSALVNVDVDGGSDGGTITNDALLDGEDQYVPVTTATGTSNFLICTGIHQDGSDTEDVPGIGTPIIPPPFQGNYCTYTQSQWVSTSDPHNILTLPNFETAFGGDIVTVGGGNTMTFEPADVTIHHTTVHESVLYFIEKYLPAGGGAGALTETVVNPTDTSSGNFGGDVLALDMNVAFGAAGVVGPNSTALADFGSLVVCDKTDASNPENGKTVASVLADANVALGGGALPGSWNGDQNGYNNFDNFISHLNVSFQQCHVTGNALNLLKPPLSTCP